MTDPYQVLGLTADSDDEAIRRRYLQLVKQFSPEHHPEQFAAIRAAYESMRDLRTWLHQAKEQGCSLQPLSGEGAADPIDLHTVLGQFTALRHEVNLQTRATRVQQEQNTETLRQFGQAVEALKQAQGVARQADQQTQEELLRPLLKVLIDVYDALALAQREVTRAQDNILSSLDDFLMEPEPDQSAEILALLDQACADTEATAPVPATESRKPRHTGRHNPLNLLWRFFHRVVVSRHPVADTRREDPEQTDRVKQLVALQEQWGRQVQQLRRLWTEQVEIQRERAEQDRGVVAQVLQVLDSVVTGYTMSVQRVARALQQLGMETIQTVGEPFDPELMEVVEAVAGADRPAGEVIDQVRPGYLWRGRVFRFAQVRVAK